MTNKDRLIMISGFVIMAALVIICRLTSQGHCPLFFLFRSINMPLYRTVNKIQRRFIMLKSSSIYTNVVDLAKKIQTLKNDGQDFDIKIVDGMGKNEKVVMLSWKYCYWEDEEAE